MLTYEDRMLIRTTRSERIKQDFIDKKLEKRYAALDYEIRKRIEEGKSDREPDLVVR